MEVDLVIRDVKPGEVDLMRRVFERIKFQSDAQNEHHFNFTAVEAIQLRHLRDKIASAEMWRRGDENFRPHARPRSLSLLIGCAADRSISE